MKKLISIACVSVLLAACGGGGDDTAAPAAGPTAEGFWGGTASSGAEVFLAILENGETWGAYTSGDSIAGALYGNTTSSGGKLSGSGRDFNIPSRTVTTASYSGSFTAKTSISLSASGTTLNGTYDSDYDTAPSLAALAGSYSGSGVSGNSSVQSITVTISPAGAVSTPGSMGCSAAGTVAPRPSGKNIFNVSMTFTGSSCALGNGTQTNGIAVYDPESQKVLVLAMNSAKSDGYIYFGGKAK